MRAVLAGAIAAAAVSAGAVEAQTTGGQAARPDDSQSIRIGTTIFYDYTVTAEPTGRDADGNEIVRNAFNVTRAYLNVTGRISRVVSFRLTPDIARETGAGSSLAGSLDFRLKFAYAQFALDDWLPAGSFLRLGIQPVGWHEFSEAIYRYRFQGTGFAERDGSLTSADAGVAARVVFPDNHGDVHAGVYNGEGYQRAEANDRKAVRVRGTLRPFAGGTEAARGLRVSVYYNGDAYQRNAERRRVIAGATYEHPRFHAAADWMSGRDRPSSRAAATDARGYSFYVTPFFGERGTGLEGLFRVDTWTPDLDAGGRQRRLIAGAAYWFPHPGGPATAALLLDYEQVTFHGFAAPRQTERRVAIHGLIAF